MIEMDGPSPLAESSADPTDSITNSKEQLSPAKGSVSYPKITSSENTPKAVLSSSITTDSLSICPSNNIPDSSPKSSEELHAIKNSDPSDLLQKG